MDSLIALITPDNIAKVFAVIGALVSAATVIVRITPTQSDDAILARIVKVLDYVSVVSAKIVPAAKL